MRRQYLATTGLRLAPGLQILLLGEIQFIKRLIPTGPLSIVWIPIARQKANIHAAGKIVTTAIEIASNASAPKNDNGYSRISNVFGNYLRNSNRTCATANASGNR